MTSLAIFIRVPALLVALSIAPVAAVADTEQRTLDGFEASARDFQAGLAAHRRGELERAMEHYEAALARDDQFVEAMVNVARLYLARGMPEEARDWIDRALIQRPDYPAGYAVRGVIELQQGDAGAAVADLARARRMAPGDAHVLANLGAAYLAQGNLDKARKSLRTALHHQPDSAAAMLNLALVHDRESDWGRAQFHYLRFLELASLTDPKRDQVTRRIELIAGTGHAGAPPRDVHARDVATQLSTIHQEGEQE